MGPAEKTRMNHKSTLSLAAGDLRAVFWPSAGMLGISLCHQEEELLRRVDDLETAKQKGSTAGIPLLYPWANRLASLHYRAAGRDVDLDPTSPLLHFDDRGLAMHGVTWGQLGWKLSKQNRTRCWLGSTGTGRNFSDSSHLPTASKWLLKSPPIL